jgi:hypothetical protein
MVAAVAITGGNLEEDAHMIRSGAGKITGLT